MRTMQQLVKVVALVAFGLALAAGAVYAQPCNVPDNGTGTVTLPPANCGYLSPNDVHLIVKGLPAGTKIILDPSHRDFFCRQSTVFGPCNVPGGPLKGEVENFSSFVVFQLTGTGTLTGWSRTLSFPVEVQVATGPRTPGARIQTFNTSMERLQGSLTNDPDFASLDLIAGTANGFPSPGTTTLTQLDNGTFNVDSTFDIGYIIRFVGATGGRLEGLSGTTQGTVTMKAQQ